MSRRTILLAAGVLSFGYFLFAAVPATLVFHLLAPLGIRGGGVTGTAWHGDARQVRLHQMYLGRTRWDLDFWPLFLGRLSGWVDTQWAGGFAKGHAAVNRAGTIWVESAQAAGSLSLVEAALGLPPAPGDFSAQVSEARIENRWPTRLAATVRLGNMPIVITGQAMADAPKGGFEAEFSSKSSGPREPVQARIRDIDGPLGVEATLKLTAPAHYLLLGRVRSKSQADPALAASLDALGPAGADGAHAFSLEGDL